MAYDVKDYTVNFEDNRFQDVKNREASELSDLEKTQADMVSQSDKHFQSQIDAVNKYSEEQQKNQQEQTDFAIQKIEQQKEQAHKDYVKEQSGAYVDWQKQSGQYGANAEKAAAQGLSGSGYSESSQVAMYNTYQNRVATARASYDLAVLNYNNGIQEAKLQNNAALAEIRFNALQQQLELSLQGFQYKNQLVLEFADRKTAVKQRYFDQWKTVLAQINAENTLAEEQRQFKASHDLKLASHDLEREKFEHEKAKDAAAAIVKTTGGGSSGSKKGSSSTTNKYGISAGNIGGTSGNAKEMPIDMKSVASLGYGPISASKLDELVSSGKVYEYEQNGKRMFTKSKEVVQRAAKSNAYLNAKKRGGTSGKF